MNLMRSLDEYEQLLPPARQRFAVSPGTQANVELTPRTAAAIAQYAELVGMTSEESHLLSFVLS